MIDLITINFIDTRIVLEEIPGLGCIPGFVLIKNNLAVLVHETRMINPTYKF
jgi:hypothetical protein